MELRKVCRSFFILLLVGGMGYAYFLVPYFMYFFCQTCVQSLVSAFLSVLLALPLSFVVHRTDILRGFPKGWVNILESIPFILPPMVVVSSLIMMGGRSIYGWHGIILAHLFFNIPVATRILNEGWKTMPDQGLFLAEQFSFSKRQRLKFYGCYLKPYIHESLILIFSVCWASFTIILILGGSPKIGSLSILIYHAILYQGAWEVAFLLISIHVIIGAVIFLRPQPLLRPAFVPSWNSDYKLSLSARGRMTLAIVSYALIFFLTFIPLVIMGEGLRAFILHFTWSDAVEEGILLSLKLSFSSALAMIMFSIVLLFYTYQYALAFAMRMMAGIVIVIPGFVLSLSIYLCLWPWRSLQSTVYVGYMLSHIICILPFVLPLLIQHQERLNRQYQQLSLALSLPKAWYRKRVLLPLSADLLKKVFALSFVMSLTDLKGGLFFGTPTAKTLPMLIYDNLSIYAFEEATALTFILFSMTIVIMIIFKPSGDKKWI